MSSEVSTSGSDIHVLEQVLITGDLSRLSSADRVEYYTATCKSLGINPLTKPLDYIILNGKTTLYAKRNCTDQLRKINGISIIIVSREIDGDCYIVRARATDRFGRQDEDSGIVPVSNLKGEARSNAMMKAETKAKRRVTLSICGLGFLDETEVSSIADAYPSSLKIEEVSPQTLDSLKIVSDVKQLLADDKAEEAYALCETISSQEQKMELWSILDPKERAQLISIREKEKENAKLS
jgi:hypothetical protein